MLRNVPPGYGAFNFTSQETLKRLKSMIACDVSAGRTEMESPQHNLVSSSSQSSESNYDQNEHERAHNCSLDSAWLSVQSLTPQQPFPMLTDLHLFALLRSKQCPDRLPNLVVQYFLRRVTFYYEHLLFVLTLWGVLRVLLCVRHWDRNGDGCCSSSHRASMGTSRMLAPKLASLLLCSCRAK
uniref:Uncharacterized protein n=1 Tax=Anopheles farauti TaxID=69004 RepID=A0A182QK63_9DIPT